MLDKKRGDTSRQVKKEDKIGQKTPKLQLSVVDFTT